MLNFVYSLGLLLVVVAVVWHSFASRFEPAPTASPAHVEQPEMRPPHVVTFDQAGGGGGGISGRVAGQLADATVHATAEVR
jgi:hypothetical protein